MDHSANRVQSYNVYIKVGIEGTSIQSENSLNLKDPYFRQGGFPTSTEGTSTQQLYQNSA